MVPPPEETPRGEGPEADSPPPATIEAEEGEGEGEWEEEAALYGGMSSSAALEIHRIMVEGILEAKRQKTEHEQKGVSGGGDDVARPAPARPPREPEGGLSWTGGQSWWATLLGV